ncbi:FAD-dependent oxidoreductase [Streptomyces sp. NPDC097619]|uniref:FAD-dependent oxidoreductase n=1 Tax=Streptomyces sp. NPDC097619 TaxID=3157228 RepID=UPI00332E443C
MVIGGGPAGCAAARMAASVGMRTVLVEPERPCHHLHRIPALDNVLGGHHGGPALAAAVTAELAATPLCRLLLGRRAEGIRTHADHVTVALDDGTLLTAPHVIVATGTAPLRPADAPWISAPDDLLPSPLWEADPGSAEGRTLLVLGGDRPIGTFLRSHPHLRTRLLVAHPAADAYKTEEVRNDPRVTLLPVTHLSFATTPGLHPVTAEWTDSDGNLHPLTADSVHLSLGNAPVAPPGDLVRDHDGHCPPAAQHSRVLIAGDLRSARYQRVMTALGSGAEAALTAYYAAQDLPG